MDHSPLNTLPPELRNNIWELALKQDHTFWIHIHDARCTVTASQDEEEGIGAGKHMLALTTTCRQIRHEALPFTFASNDWCTAISHPSGRPDPARVTDALRQWLGSLGNGAARRFRKIRVWLGHMSSEEQFIRWWQIISDGSDVAMRLYQRYKAISSSFDTALTRLSIDIGPVFLRTYHNSGCLSFESCHPNLSTKLPSTLRQEVEELIRRVDAAFENVNVQARAKEDGSSLALIRGR